eukprot:scaffold57809_cov33-Tisochrysis_lutea.AAC.2
MRGVCGSRTKDDHVEEISSAATEAALLKQAAVAYEEEHVEEEVEPYRAEEEEVGEDSPDLCAQRGGRRDAVVHCHRTTTTRINAAGGQLRCDVPET